MKNTVTISLDAVKKMTQSDYVDLAPAYIFALNKVENAGETDFQFKELCEFCNTFPRHVYTYLRELQKLGLIDFEPLSIDHRLDKAYLEKELNDSVIKNLSILNKADSSTLEYKETDFTSLDSVTIPMEEITNATELFKFKVYANLLAEAQAFHRNEDYFDIGLLDLSGRTGIKDREVDDILKELQVERMLHHSRVWKRLSDGSQIECVRVHKLTGWKPVL